MRTIVETLDPDVPYQVRQAIGPWLTRIARTIGQPEYELRETEYVGTIRQPLDEFTRTLQDHGFDWDPLAWYHQPPIGSEANGSWVYRPTVFADRQLHVILIAHSPEYIDVFAHEEYNWLRHPVKHIRQLDIEREPTSDDLRRWFETQEIDIDERMRLRRRVTNKTRALRKRLQSVVQ
jgi:hypothetical protein